MFGSKENNGNSTAAATTPAKPGTTAPAGANVLVKGTTIEGKIVSEGDIRIDGIVRGSIDCKAKIVIGATGVVDGDIICQNALIEGKFDGTLVVKEMLSLRGTAQVNGDISTQKLVVEAGALFNVTCKMGAQK